MKKILITDGNTVLHAELNDTAAAKDFEKRLPFKCAGCDSGVDYCCYAAAGRYDPTELQTGWKNGDISLGGGWFALLYGVEEQSESYRNMMIIGHINDEDLSNVHAMPNRVSLTVAEEEDEKTAG